MIQPMYRREDPDTEVYVGDCREVLENIKESSVDLIFADPPFNWDVPYDEWVDAKPREEYLEFTWCIWHFRFGQHRTGNFIVSKAHALYFARDKDHRDWNPEAVLEPSDRAAIYDDPRTRSTRQPGL